MDDLIGLAATNNILAQLKYRICVEPALIYNETVQPIVAEYDVKLASAGLYSVRWSSYRKIPSLVWNVMSITNKNLEAYHRKGFVELAKKYNYSRKESRTLGTFPEYVNAFFRYYASGRATNITYYE